MKRVLKYELRRWNDGGKYAWHVFERVERPRRWWQAFARYDTVLVHKAGSEAEAVDWMRNATAGQYDQSADYDATGTQIFYGY